MRVVNCLIGFVAWFDRTSACCGFERKESRVFEAYVGGLTSNKNVTKDFQKRQFLKIFKTNFTPTGKTEMID